MVSGGALPRRKDVMHWEVPEVRHSWGRSEGELRWGAVAWPALTEPAPPLRMCVLCHPPHHHHVPPLSAPSLWSCTGTPEHLGGGSLCSAGSGESGKSGEEVSLLYFSLNFKMYCHTLKFHNFVLLWLSWSIYPRVEFLGHWVCRGSFLGNTTREFLKVVVGVHTHSSVWMFQLLGSSPTLGIVSISQLFWCRCRGLSLWFSSAFSWWVTMLCSFSCPF